MNKKKCLNVGSGRDYKASTDAEEWVNFDINPEVYPDVVGDVAELARHFGENDFDEIHLLHVWEHCPDLMGVMEQIYHVLKPGGKLVIACPYYTNKWAQGDPTHCHTVGEHTFAFLNYPSYEDNAKKGSRMSQLFPKCDFDIVRIALVPMPENDTFKDERFAIKHYFNVVEEIQAELVAVKPIRSFDIKQYQKRG